MRDELVRFLQNEQAPKFQKVVSELMRAKGIKILLHRQSVLGFDTGDPTLNLTPEVVELLNQQEE
jgi:Skp family chaperone for outer membrane proteins